MSVEVRIGSGVYVMGPRPVARGAEELPADSGPFELIKARWLIEAECAALAAREGTRAQVKAIEEALERLSPLERAAFLLHDVEGFGHRAN